MVESQQSFPFQIIFNQRVGDILSGAGHNVTFINLQLFEFKKNTEITPQPGSEVWNIDAKSDSVDYVKIWKNQAELAYSDDSMISMLWNTERRNHIVTMSSILKQGCESKCLRNCKNTY